MDRPNSDQTLLHDPMLEAVLHVWRQAQRQHWLRITGCSMLPLIREGDRVLVAHGHAGIRRGHVVVFRRDGKLTAHRVIRISGSDNEPIVVTKGDNTLQYDSTLSAGDIVGRVLTLERRGRRMSLDTPAWRVLGWLIAVSAVAWTALDKWGLVLKRRLMGSRRYGLIAFLLQSRRRCFSYVLKAVQAACGRWTT